MTVQQVQQVEALVDWRKRLEKLRGTWVTQKFPAIAEGLAAQMEGVMKDLGDLNDALAKELLGDDQGGVGGGVEAEVRGEQRHPVDE